MATFAAGNCPPCSGRDVTIAVVVEVDDCVETVEGTLASNAAVVGVAGVAMVEGFDNVAAVVVGWVDVVVLVTTVVVGVSGTESNTENEGTNNSTAAMVSKNETEHNVEAKSEVSFTPMAIPP